MRASAARGVSILLQVIGVLAILAGGWALQSFPIVKRSSPDLLGWIEKQYMRKDLTEKERDDFEWCRDRILGHERSYRTCWGQIRTLAMIGLPLMGVLLILSARRRPPSP